jgi:hypothetical protein
MLQIGSLAEEVDVAGVGRGHGYGLCKDLNSSRNNEILLLNLKNSCYKIFPPFDVYKP